jgi:soluble cytochrome b562
MQYPACVKILEKAKALVVGVYTFKTEHKQPSCGISAGNSEAAAASSPKMKSRLQGQLSLSQEGFSSYIVIMDSILSVATSGKHEDSQSSSLQPKLKHLTDA